MTVLQPKLVLLLVVLLIALVTDLWRRKIYNWLILVGLLAGLVLQSVDLGTLGALNWLKGVALAFGLFIPLYLVRGMAAGDVKLMMVIGGLLGVTSLIQASIYVYIAGGLLALGIVLYRKQGQRLWQNIKVLLFGQFVKATSGVQINNPLDHAQSVGKMPYALAICMGTLYALYKQAFVI